MALREQKALNLLFNPETYPGMIARKRDQIKFILWINDSLGDFISWTLFESENHYYVRRVIWKQRELCKLKEPITYCHERIISSEFVPNILKGFYKSVLTYSENQLASVCIDGISKGVSYSGRKIGWNDWNDGGNEFSISLSKIIDWYNDTASIFGRYFDLCQTSSNPLSGIL